MRDRHRKKMGMVFQHFNLFPHMTVLENMTLAPVQLKKKSLQEAQAQAMELLGRVGLTGRAGAYPGQLSGGMARRAALARALAVGGDVWLLDEPFAGVDLSCAQRIMERLKALDRPMVLTGHTPQLAQLCDRVVTL